MTIAELADNIFDAMYENHYAHCDDDDSLAVDVCQCVSAAMHLAFAAHRVWLSEEMAGQIHAEFRQVLERHMQVVKQRN